MLEKVRGRSEEIAEKSRIAPLNAIIIIYYLLDFWLAVERFPGRVNAFPCIKMFDQPLKFSRRFPVSITFHKHQQQTGGVFQSKGKALANLSCVCVSMVLLRTEMKT